MVAVRGTAWSPLLTFALTSSGVVMMRITMAAATTRMAIGASHQRPRGVAPCALITPYYVNPGRPGVEIHRIAAGIVVDNGYVAIRMLPDHMDHPAVGIEVG